MFTPCLPEQTDGPRFPPCYNQYQKKLCCEIKYTGQPWTGPYRGSRVVWHVVVRPWPWDYCDGIGQQQGASSVRFYLNLFLRPSRSLNSFHWTRLPDRIGIVHGTGCCDTNTCTPLRCGPPLLSCCAPYDTWLRVGKQMESTWICQSFCHAIHGLFGGLFGGALTTWLL